MLPWTVTVDSRSAAIFQLPLASRSASMSSSSSSSSSWSWSSAPESLPSSRPPPKGGPARWLRLRGGGVEEEEEDDDDRGASSLFPPYPPSLYYRRPSRGSKRGTLTTGAGSSGRRPSIFAADATDADARGPSRGNDGGDDNPMRGRIWVRKTRSGSLVFKLAADGGAKGEREGKDGEGGDGDGEVRSEEFAFVELYEDRSGDDDAEADASAGMRSPHLSRMRARRVAPGVARGEEGDESSPSPSPSWKSSFVPIEGIYGVYDLPASGPHVVLIAESEGAYASPPPPPSSSSSPSSPSPPLLELRRVISLEATSLRDGGRRDETTGTAEGRRLRRRRLEEERRRWRLLRRSFREHDLYFAVPPSSGGEDGDADRFVVADVTRTLQRSFLEQSSRAASAKGEEERLDNRWWTPYLADGRGGGGSAAPRANGAGPDPRFFWNEHPALSLLPPSSTGDDDDDDDLPSSPSSPYALLLDRVVPVTSAFVGVRRDVPIPAPSPRASSAENAEGESYRYDQLLVSRRSRRRAGTRFTRRGVDETGSVANYAETEQVCLVVRSKGEDEGDGDGDGDGQGKDATGDGGDRNDRGDRRLVEVYSHVQTRGSIPLHWSSPANVREYRPRVYVGIDPLAQARAMRDHLLGELRRYASPGVAGTEADGVDTNDANAAGGKVRVAMVNLIDKHGDQGRLGRAFDAVLSALLEVYGSVEPRENRPKRRKRMRENPNTKLEAPPLRQRNLCPGSIEHIWYDFHAECKGGRWDRLLELLKRVAPTLNGQGYLCVVPTAGEEEDRTSWEIVSLQDGVVRTNCMDCLDRTNVVQSMFGRHVLYRQLHERLGLPPSSDAAARFGRPPRRVSRTLPLECVVGYKQQPLKLPWSEGEAAHRHLWADNADAISRLYAGTPALKGDFTRTGKRTKRGALDDGLNSLQRYYLNNFIDADRQEGMDLLVGTSDFDVAPPPLSEEEEATDEESARASALQELAKRRGDIRGYDETHARIKVEITDDASLDGEGTEGMLAPKWLPGNFRHHMRKAAMWSRAPLSPAAVEEDLDVRSSSDFLLQVTSSAAGDDVPMDVDALEVLRSIDRRSFPARPWWMNPVEGEGYGGGGQLDDICDLGSFDQINSQSTLTAAKKRAMAASLLLLTRAPIISAAIIAAVIASNFNISD